MCASVTLGDARRILGPRASGDHHIPPAKGCYHSSRGRRTATANGFTRINKVLAVQVTRPTHGGNAPAPGRPVTIPGLAGKGSWSELPTLGSGPALSGGTLSVITKRGIIRVTVIGTDHDLAFATQVAADVARAET